MFPSALGAVDNVLLLRGEGTRSDDVLHVDDDIVEHLQVVLPEAVPAVLMMSKTVSLAVVQWRRTLMNVEYRQGEQPVEKKTVASTPVWVARSFGPARAGAQAA